MSTPVDLRNPGRTLHVGVILTAGRTEILDVAPMDLLHGISKRMLQDFPPGLIPESMRATAKDIDFHWVTQDGKDAALTSGITLKATDDFETCPPLDIALMGAHDLAYQPSEAELAFIRKTADHCAAFLGICGGCVDMSMAGILRGKTATAPRFILDQFRQMAPDTEWTEKRWERDGKFWTSGALLNGLDMMKEFAQDTWGPTGNMVQFVVEAGSWPRRANDYSADSAEWEKCA